MLKYAIFVPPDLSSCYCMEKKKSGQICSRNTVPCQELTYKSNNISVGTRRYNVNTMESEVMY